MSEQNASDHQLGALGLTQRQKMTPDVALDQTMPLIRGQALVSGTIMLQSLVNAQAQGTQSVPRDALFYASLICWDRWDQSYIAAFSRGTWELTPDCALREIAQVVSSARLCQHPSEFIASDDLYVVGVAVASLKGLPMVNESIDPSAVPDGDLKAEGTIAATWVRLHDKTTMYYGLNSAGQPEVASTGHIEVEKGRSPHYSLVSSETHLSAPVQLMDNIIELATLSPEHYFGRALEMGVS